MATAHGLRELLKPRATTAERVRGLLAAGLHTSALARVTGVSESAVRNWTSGQAEPRPNAAITIDDLRATTKILLDGGLDPARATRWLTSRNDDGDRPIDQIATRPMAVISAAHGEVLDNDGERDGERDRDGAPGVVVAIGRNAE